MTTTTQALTGEQLKQTIFRALKQIAPEADLDALPPDANVRETLDSDSFDFLNFLIALNQELGIEIPEADYGELNTLNQLIRYLLAHSR